MIETIFSLPRFILMPIVLIGYSTACLGAGILILKFSAVPVNWMEQVSAGTIFATGFILGQGVLASIWLLLALGGWFSIQVVGILCFIFAVAGLCAGRRLFLDVKKQIKSIWTELSEETWGWQLIAGLTVILCLLWATNLGRPLAGDGPSFYLALGKLIAFSQHLSLLPGYERFIVGLQGELHFAALMTLHSPEAAKIFTWPTIIMAGIMLAALGRMVGMGRRGQWLTLGMLFSSSAVFQLGGWGKVDLFAAALGLAAYYWAVQIRFTRTKMALLLTGLFSGFSIVAKLSYAAAIIPTIVLLFLWSHEAELKSSSQWRSTLRSFIGSSLIILAGVILAFLPHFFKNGLLYHNPIAPIGSDSGIWLNQSWFGSGITRQILLTYPLALTYGSYWSQGGNISPLALAFLPLALYLPRPRHLLISPLAIISLIGLVGVIAWILYSPSVFAPRYILATLLLLILLPARSAEYLSLNDQRPRLLAFVIVTSTVVSLSAVGLYGLNRIFFPGDTFKYLTQTMDECERDGRYCEAMEKVNRRAELGDRVYLAAFPRYWLRGDLLQCLYNRDDKFSTIATDEQLWLEVYQRGFRYLIIDETVHGFMTDRLDFAHVPPWVDLKLLYDKEPLSVYEVNFYNPPSTAQPIVCQRVQASTIWEIRPPNIPNGDQNQ